MAEKSHNSDAAAFVAIRGNSWLKNKEATTAMQLNSWLKNKEATNLHEFARIKREQQGHMLIDG
ncbi:MAG: hypothetical protein R2828_28475 [Saprospiraceae bacterium]